MDWDLFVKTNELLSCCSVATSEDDKAILASDADPDNAFTDPLITWSVVVSELLNEDIGAIDEPLILVTNSFLASEDEPLSIVVE